MSPPPREDPAGSASLPIGLLPPSHMALILWSLPVSVLSRAGPGSRHMGSRAPRLKTKGAYLLTLTSIHIHPGPPPTPPSSRLRPGQVNGSCGPKFCDWGRCASEDQGGGFESASWALAVAHTILIRGIPAPPGLRKCVSLQEGRAHPRLTRSRGGVRTQFHVTL